LIVEEGSGGRGMGARDTIEIIGDMVETGRDAVETHGGLLVDGRMVDG